MKTRKLGKAGFSLLLALVFLLVPAAPAAVAAGNGAEVERLVVTFHGDSRTQRGISWFTQERTRSDVQLMEAERFTGAFTDPICYEGTVRYYRQNYAHRVILNDLQPGTEYVYRVGDRALNVWSETGRFVTDAGGDAAFSFLTIADVQADNETDFAKAAEVLDKGFELVPDGQFIANLGDFVNDCGNEQWDMYFRNFERHHLRVTLAPVSGNHDGLPSWFRRQFPVETAEPSLGLDGDYYSFDYGNAHFAVLNTNDMFPMTSAQVNWLRNDMRASDADWKIVMMHRSLYSAGKNYNKPDTMIMHNRLVPVMDELGIDLVLSGHDHMYFRTKQMKEDEAQATSYVQELYNGELTTFACNPEGTVYILPNTAGTKRYPVHTETYQKILDAGEVVTQPGRPVFAGITIDGDKLIYKAYAYDVDGTKQVECIDRYAIQKTLSDAPPAPFEPDPTDYASLWQQDIDNFIVHVARVLMDYCVLIPQLIRHAIENG
ncbi:MAG TPA: metallophosphoesterase family protein [Candidatus Fimivicinus intestinavium]|nr:metallophosphoesterase family protein [Candidatus Fimivicinus intestinavium]